jgi:hypothetical protein
MGDITKFLNSPFLQNKFVLYGSLLIVLLAILRFLANHNFNAIVLMALIGLLTSFFSKNMIIVLLTPFFAVVVLELIRGDMMIEGLENKAKDNDKDKDAAAATTDPATTTTTDNDAAAGAVNKESDNNDDETVTVTEGETGQTTANDKPAEEKEHKPATKKQGMATLTPANYDGKDGKTGKAGSTANRIDYAATLEQAYDNIDNIIGEDGVRGLTDQTKSLMNQQKELMNNMKDIEPLLKSAQGFMSQMTGKEGITGISKMLQGFAGATKKPAEDAKA